MDADSRLAEPLSPADVRIAREEVGEVCDQLPLALAATALHTPEEIAWHTEQLIKHGGPSTSALVSVNRESARGGTAILVYTEYAQRNFARLTAVLDELGLNIVAAAITPTADGHSIDTYLVLENDGTPIGDDQRARQIERAVSKVMTATDDKPMEVTRQAPRQVRMFSTSTRISFSQDPRGRTRSRACCRPFRELHLSSRSQSRLRRSAAALPGGRGPLPRAWLPDGRRRRGGGRACRRSTRTKPPAA